MTKESVLMMYEHKPVQTPNFVCPVIKQELVEYYQSHSLKESFKLLDTTLRYPYKSRERSLTRASTRSPGTVPFYNTLTIQLTNVILNRTQPELCKLHLSYMLACGWISSYFISLFQFRSAEIVAWASKSEHITNNPSRDTEVDLIRILYSLELPKQWRANYPALYNVQWWIVGFLLVSFSANPALIGVVLPKTLYFFGESGS